MQCTAVHRSTTQPGDILFESNYLYFLCIYGQTGLSNLFLFFPNKKTSIDMSFKAKITVPALHSEQKCKILQKQPNTSVCLDLMAINT